MKKYSFRLQTVLNLKEKALDEKLIELSKVVAILNKENARLDELEQKHSTSTSDLAQMYASNDVLDISKIQLYKNYIAKISKEIFQQKKIIENVVKMVELQQLEVNKALKEKKIYEKLKEKDTEKFFKEIESKERAEADDIAILKYARK